MFLWHYPHDRSHWALPSKSGLSGARTFLKPDVACYVYWSATACAYSLPRSSVAVNSIVLIVIISNEVEPCKANRRQKNEEPKENRYNLASLSASPPKSGSCGRFMYICLSFLILNGGEIFKPTASPKEIN